jgi:cytochrome c oxidase subunit 2
MRLLGLCATLLTSVAVASAALAQDLARGEALFALCSQCHGGEALGNPLYLAPAIAGLEQWYTESQLRKFRDGTRGTHFDDLTGMRMRPMAKWLKTDEDLAAVAAYVASLPDVKPETRLEGGDAARGAPIYATCAGCHGVRGEGNQAVSAPGLRYTSDWYQLTQLKNYKQGIRGTHPRDVEGAAMRGMSMMLVDEQIMKDVIAYVLSLPE